MKKAITLLLFGISLSNPMWSQDKGYCFLKDEPTMDPKLNSIVASQLKNITDLGGTIPQKVEYTGHHVIFKQVYYEKNAFDIVKFRYHYVHAAYRKAGDSTCTITGYLVVEEAIGGGRFAEPEVLERMEDIMPVEPNIGFKKYKSCGCTSMTKNWLGDVSEDRSGSNSYSSGNTNTTSKKEKAPTVSRTVANKNTTPDGPFEKKDNTGQVQQTGTYKDQKKQGLWKTYDGGKLTLEENYIDDLKDGMETQYNTTSGAVDLKREYKAGQQTGKEQRFEDGKLKSNNMYLNGKRHGKCTNYNNDGSKSSEGNFSNGARDGELIYYSAKGLPTSIETYKDDRLNGPYKKFYESKLREEGSYLNGMQDGVWKKFDNFGKVTETKTYKDGVPQ